MSSLRYVLASLVHYRRVQLAVAAGVAVATAVITGALIVGDSVRGSLKELTLERLGRIETVLVALHPFREELAQEFTNRATGQDLTAEAVPLVLTRGTLKTTGRGEAKIAAGASVVGCPEELWSLGAGGPEHQLGRRELAITAPLAEELGVEVGDDLLLRLPAAAALPGDSTLAEKDDTIVSRRFKLAVILPSQGIARFSLQPTQRSLRNVFLPLQEAQDLLEWEGKANSLAVAQAAKDIMPSDEYWNLLSDVPLQPTLEDMGLQLQPVTLGVRDERIALQLTSRSMVLPDHVVEVSRRELADQHPQQIVTYLANTIEAGEGKIPYSTITGVKSSSEFGPLLDEAGEPIGISHDEIVLNDWAAQDLGAKIGDEVVVTYYHPETTHGTLREAEPLKLKLKAIVPLADTEGEPTRAADPDLTPELQGVTDQRSISDWDLPFELVEEIRAQDEEYWDEYSTTPKAFVSLELAKKLWHTRWGTVSGLRFQPVDLPSTSLKLTEALEPAQLGMTWLPVRLQGLQASRGTTSFEGLFIGFSFFLMASALLLVNLLFRLGIEGRAAEIGLLSAVGYSASKLRWLLLGEAAIVALVGASVGVLAGVGYARLMIHGLSTWWVAATVEPFLSLHVSPQSLALGLVIGVVVALATTALSLRKTVRLPVRQLMAGDCSDPQERLGIGRARYWWVPAVLVAVAVGLTFIAKNLTGEAQAGAFFGAGALVLTALLWRLRQRLRERALTLPNSLSLPGLAARNARRSPSRSILSVGLAAVASFLIVALSAFRLAPSEQGTGGYDLIATADQSILYDLNTESGREEMGFSATDNQLLDSVVVESLRVSDGEDASCLNLYQTTQPRVVGVPEDFAEGNNFAFSALAPDVDEEEPWNILESQPGQDTNGRDVVPIVLDKNTATYSLHLSGIGARMTIRDGFDQEVTLEVVGLLAGSVLQGDVLMSEANFLRLFPDVAGRRLFLIRCGEQPVDEVAQLLQGRLEDYGFHTQDTRQRLADFMAVQNTYLSTFQSLGALGLLLGTLGLAIAQLRSVLERRGELALLRSAGFRRSRLAEMVLGENLVLLLGGLSIGCLAAAVAVLPHWWLGEADTPWSTLLAMLLAVALAGTIAGGLAIRAAVRAPLVAALRGE